MPKLTKEQTARFREKFGRFYVDNNNTDGSITLDCEPAKIILGSDEVESFLASELELERKRAAGIVEKEWERAGKHAAPYLPTLLDKILNQDE